MTKGATQEIERELTVLLRGAHRVLLSAVEGDIALDRAAYGTMCKLADDGPQHLAARQRVRIWTRPRSRAR